MDRIHTMARFAEPEEPKQLASCDGCYEGLFEGDKVLKLEGEHFCDTECLLTYIDAKEVVLGDD